MRQRFLLFGLLIFIIGQTTLQITAQNKTSQNYDDLRRAIEENDVPRARGILEKLSPDDLKNLLNEKDIQNGATVLHWSAYLKNEQIVKILMDSGADVNAKNNNYDLPLHQAIITVKDKSEEDVLKVIELLTEKLPEEYNYDIPNKDGTTPLHLATSVGYLKVMKFFLDRFSDPNFKDKRTSFSYAALIKDPAQRKLALDELKKYLLVVQNRKRAIQNKTYVAQTNPPKTNPQTEDNITELRQFINTGNVEKVQAALKNLMQLINIPDSEGNTLLHLAARACMNDVVAELIRSGADVNSKNDKKQTFLQIACSQK